MKKLRTYICLEGKNWLHRSYQKHQNQLKTSQDQILSTKIYLHHRDRSQGIRDKDRTGKENLSQRDKGLPGDRKQMWFIGKWWFIKRGNQPHFRMECLILTEQINQVSQMGAFNFWNLIHWQLDLDRQPQQEEMAK